MGITHPSLWRPPTTIFCADGVNYDDDREYESADNVPVASPGSGMASSLGRFDLLHSLRDSRHHGKHSRLRRAPRRFHFIAAPCERSRRDEIRSRDRGCGRTIARRCNASLPDDAGGSGQCRYRPVLDRARKRPQQHRSNLCRPRVFASSRYAFFCPQLLDWNSTRPSRQHDVEWPPRAAACRLVWRRHAVARHFRTYHVVAAQYLAGFVRREEGRAGLALSSSIACDGRRCQLGSVYHSEFLGRCNFLPANDGSVFADEV
jgi:hypothetical protein